MKKLNRFYIGGHWHNASSDNKIDIINPATEEIIGTVALGNSEDVDKAVEAATNAFKSFSKTTKSERLDLLRRILACYEARYDDFATAITLEMGAPKNLSHAAQAYTGIEHFKAAIDALKDFDLVQAHDGFSLHHEGIGVCGLITPWNWPINQIACKVAPALAAGCAIILKPSEYSALSAQLFAEVMDEAGVPAGVFNMIYGDGTGVGSALSNHTGIDMISFTGSTRAGITIAKAAADTVKRVSQELGGNSPMIITEGTDLETAVPECVWLCMENSGQSCNAGTRLLVPASIHDKVVEIARNTVLSYRVGNPEDENVQIGPLANSGQFEKVKAILEDIEKTGEKPIVGGAGAPDGINKGYFIKPTIYAGIDNNHPIAKQEVFGPVLAIIAYKNIEEAVNIANDTPYGLSAYVYGNDEQIVDKISHELRAGMVHINGAPLEPMAPFGGYKQSGNGREWGVHGLHEFMEVKAIMTNVKTESE